MTIVHIPAAAGKYGRFSLGSSNGQLTLKRDSGFVVVARPRGAGDPIRLSVENPIDVASIEPKIFIYTETGARGLFELEFEHAGKAAVIHALVGGILLDCDANRDGEVELDGQGKANWIWGEGGRGAIVLVDNDLDAVTGGGIEEREPLEVRSLGVEALPPGLRLRLWASAESALNFSVLRKTETGYAKVLGRMPGEPPQALVTENYDIAPSGETLYVAAHAFPGPFFDGLLLLTLELLEEVSGGEAVVAIDRVLMRVAPWIMTPNTLPARRIYTVRIAYGPEDNNDEFLKGLSAAVEAEGLEIEIIDSADYGNDRWIQDEIEIGYSESHRGVVPSVFDSPRDRYLDAYPEARMLGPDFGHFVVGGGVPNSLDSFGNLEVSPPVMVEGRNYPLGRIIVGGRRDGDLSRSTRAMMTEVRQFLYAQRVQFPFEIYTDWLAVGHVDEIVSFVSDENAPKGFRCLLASPERVKSVLLDLQKAGHGSVTMFEGLHRTDPYTGEASGSAETTPDKLLADADFWAGNDVYQDILAQVRAVLERELGLTDNDIVEIPVAFQVNRMPDNSLQRTLAYFPDMANHLVHKDLSIVPKPYGPVIDGKCAFEKAFEEALPSRRVKFIDDWYSYHEQSGEVHCGTNAWRRPFTVSKWWHVKPEGAYDIKTLQV